MKTLITSEEVVSAAFSGNYMPASAITEADIAAAAEKWIVPVIGRRLYDSMVAGEYPPLRNDYAAPALALYTRITVQPRLDVSAGQLGTVAMKSAAYSPATDGQSDRVRRSLLSQARTLMRRMSAYLDASAGEYPEYDPAQNILNKCTIDGNIIQIY